MLTHRRIPGTLARSGASARTTPDQRQQRTAIALHLFERLDGTADDTERDRLLAEIVDLHLDVAASIASRYRCRGVDNDDLDQVAYLGLFKAAQRYDMHAGFDFMSYALPTIRGEIRRHFRDHGWTVRPPRRIQELQQRMRDAQTDLERELGRSPRPTEMAARLGVDPADVIEAVSARGCFSPTSLDQLTTTNDSSALHEFLGVADPEQGAVEARAVLAPLVRELTERDRHILSLRFFSDRTQGEIAADIGVTQMQVSRLLARILRDLRQQLDDGASSGPDHVVAMGHLGRSD